MNAKQGSQGSMPGTSAGRVVKARPSLPLLGESIITDKGNRSISGIISYKARNSTDGYSHMSSLFIPACCPDMETEVFCVAKKSNHREIPLSRNKAKMRCMASEGSSVEAVHLEIPHKGKHLHALCEQRAKRSSALP